MNITIVGGGNIGTQFAVHAASKGHQVTIFTSKPEKWSRRINVTVQNPPCTAIVLHNSDT